MNARRKPDLEAESVKVRAKNVENCGYVRARNTHDGNRLRAKGDVEITVTAQHPGPRTRASAPPGTVLVTHGDE